MMRHIAILLTLSGALACCAPAAADFKPKNITDDVGIDQRLGAQVPLDLEFTDEHGKAVRLADYFGKKPVILTCVYFRCPMLCTEVLNGVLKSSQAMKLQMGADYTVVSVSIDPSDTPEMAYAKKQTYARSYRRPGADEGWHFLTGTPQAIAKLTQTVGFRYRYDPQTDQFAHASGIMVLTPQGKISRYHYGIDYPPGDLRLSLVESSQDRIGGLVDQVLLLCFHYNPATGRYGLAISTVLRLVSLALVVFGGAYLLRMYRFERRRTLLAALQDNA